MLAESRRLVACLLQSRNGHLHLLYHGLTIERRALLLLWHQTARPCHDPPARSGFKQARAPLRTNVHTGIDFHTWSYLGDSGSPAVLPEHLGRCPTISMALFSTPTCKPLTLPCCLQPICRYLAACFISLCCLIRRRSLYLVFSCAFVVVSYDSAQGLSSRYELTKKWRVVPPAPCMVGVVRLVNIETLSAFVRCLLKHVLDQE